MQSVWQVNNNKNLLLFFSGWGMDERPTAHLQAVNYDICTCFNYHSLETEESESWKRYETVTVAAWSMGVWAAGQVLAGMDIPLRRTLAVNGTPVPVDNRLGIPEHVAKGTLDSLTPESLLRFYRRMVGSGTLLKKMDQSGSLPCIHFEERKEELRRIIDRKPYPDTGFQWDRAIIGTGDAIFPVENMQAYWQGRADILELDAPHYPFHLFRTWEEVVGGF